MTKLLPPSKSSAIVKSSKSAIIKYDKLLNIKSNKTKVYNDTKKVNCHKLLESSISKIENKVNKIDKLLKGSLSFIKKENTKKRIFTEEKKFEDQEKELEKNKPKEVKGVKLPSTPKMGLFGWIKNFITQTLLGFFVIKFYDFLPQILKLLPTIIRVSDFIINIGGKLLDGLVTFIDIGYKAYDATRGFIKNIFGEGGVKQFDQLSSLLNKFLNLAIIAGMLGIGSGGGSGKGGRRGGPGGRGGGRGPGTRTRTGGAPQGRPDIRNPLRERPRVTTTGGGQQGRPDIRNPFRERPTVTQGGKGGGFRFPWSKAPVTGGGGSGGGIGRFFRNIKLPSFKMPSGLSRIMGPAFKGLGYVALIPAVFEVVNAFKEGRPKDAIRTIITAGLSMAAFNFVLGATGAAAIGETVFSGGFATPAAIATLIGGTALATGAAAGTSAGTEILLKKLGLEDKPKAMAEGGKATTRKSKTPPNVRVRSKRTLKKKKQARTLEFIPRKIEPGSSIGGKDKIQQLIPDTKKESQGFFGWFKGLTGGNNSTQQTKSQEKTQEKTSNPQEFLVKSNETLGRSDFFGPFFTIALKTVLGQRPDQLDYANTGKGLNSWMQSFIKEGSLGFAGGGEVDIAKFFSGEDYTDVIAKSVEESVSSRVDKTVRDLQKEVALNRGVGREEMIQENIERSRDQEDPSLEPGGPGVTVSGGNADFWTLVAIASREDSDPQAWADIAQSIYNRAATGMYSGGKSIKGIITASGQYEPTFSNPREWKEISDLASAAKASGKSQSHLQRVAAAIKDPKLQSNAASFIGGRSDFMGESQKGSMRADRGDVTRGPGDNYFGWFYNAKLKGPARAPALGDIKIMGGSGSSGSNIELGRGYGSAGSKIAGELGRYIKQKLRQGPDFQAVTEHPEHGGVLGGHARNSYHYSGRAIDVGAYSWEQPKILKVVSEFNKLKGVKPVELLKAGDSGHSDHVHIAYATGGKTLNKPHMAMIGEKGSEYVIDADSYKSTEKVLPGLLDILNYDVHDKTSLQKNMPKIINSLSRYTDYEKPYPEPEIQFITVPIPYENESYLEKTTRVSKPSIDVDFSSIDNMGENIKDTLMYG